MRQIFKFSMMLFLLAAFIPATFAQKVADFPKAETSPVIDGTFDDWTDFDEVVLEVLRDGTDPDDATDFLPVYKATWDDNALYLYVGVADQTLVGDVAEAWQNDNVEISIDGNADRSFNMFWEPQDSDMKIMVRYGATLENVKTEGLNLDAHDLSNMEYAQADITGGWAFEIKLPFDAIAADIDFGNFSKIIMELNAGDNDTGGAGSTRETQLSWSGTSNMNNDPAEFGTIAFYQNPSQTKAVEMVLSELNYSIDGDFSDWENDELWGFKVVRQGLAAITDSADLAPEWTMKAGNGGLYIYVSIQDETLVGDHDQAWHNDNVEIAFDGNGDDSYNMFWEPDETDFKLVIKYGSSLTDVQTDGLNCDSRDFTGMEYNQMDITGGWAFEMKLPYSVFSADFAVDFKDTMNIELAVTDNDQGATADRETILGWSGNSNMNNDPAGFAQVVLVDNSFSADDIFGNRSNYTELNSDNWKLMEYDEGNIVYMLHNSGISPIHNSGDPWYDPDGPDSDEYGNGSASGFGELAVVGSETFTDFRLTCKVARPSFEEDNGFYDNGFIWGFVDENNYNYINLNKSEGGTLAASFEEGEGYRGGSLGLNQVIDYSVVLFQDTALHEVIIEKVGNKVIASYGGTAFLSIDDAAISEQGAIGLGAWNDAAIFDDVVVETISSLTGSTDVSVASGLGTVNDTAIIAIADGATAQELIDEITLGTNASASILDGTTGTDSHPEIDDYTVNITDSHLLLVKSESGFMKIYELETSTLDTDNSIVDVFSPVSYNETTGELSVLEGVTAALIVEKVKCPESATEMVVDGDGNQVDAETEITDGMSYRIVAENGDVADYPIILTEPDYPVVGITKTTEENAVIIDAWFDEWANLGAENNLEVLADEATLPETADLSGYFKAAWDADYLYLYFNITDDNINVSETDAWENDGLEIALLMTSTIEGRSGWNPFWQPETQPGNQKLMYVYGYTLAQAATDGQNTSSDMRDYSGGIIEMYDKDDGTGYEVEMQLPWTGLNGIDNENSLTPEEGAELSLNIALNDNDGSGREDILFWATPNTNGDGDKYGILRLSGPTAIKDVSALETQVYPNPVADKLIISSKQSIQKIYITNPLGQLVNMKDKVNDSNFELNVQNLANGVYILKVVAQDGSTSVQQFVKQ